MEKQENKITISLLIKMSLSYKKGWEEKMGHRVNVPSLGKSSQKFFLDISHKNLFNSPFNAGKILKLSLGDDLWINFTNW